MLSALILSPKSFFKNISFLLYIGIVKNWKFNVLWLLLKYGRYQVWIWLLPGLMQTWRFYFYGVMLFTGGKKPLKLKIFPWSQFLTQGLIARLPPPPTPLHPRNLSQGYILTVANLWKSCFKKHQEYIGFMIW